MFVLLGTHFLHEQGLFQARNLAVPVSNRWRTLCLEARMSMLIYETRLRTSVLGALRMAGVASRLTS